MYIFIIYYISKSKPFAKPAASPAAHGTGCWH